MIRPQVLSNGFTDVRLPNIMDFLSPSSGDEESTDEQHDDRPDPYPPVRGELDGDLFVYSADDIDELSVEAFSQLSARDDLSEQQAEEIADLFRTLHRLDVSEVEA